MGVSAVESAILRVADITRPLPFDRSRPLEVEVGCGKGKFLTSLAAANPDCDYLGIERMLERGGQSVYLMLCTIVDKRGVPMRESPALDRLSRKLGDALSHSVRRSDAICRYGKGQYLALLMNTTREDCGIVQKRVNYYFLAGTQRAGVEYYVNSVFFTREGDRLKNA